MDENKNPAQTSGEAGASAAVGDNAGADKASNVGTETASDASFTDDSAQKGADVDGKGAADPDTSKSAPKGEKSSEFARRRREAEQAKAIKEAEEKAIIRALDGINPYTEEEMKDSHDVAEFLEMQEIKKNGGDPLSDFAKHRKERERKAAEEKAREQAASEQMNRDLSDFSASYPDVNIDELIKDEAFNDYADGKIGRKTLKQIYEGYLGFVDRQRRAAESKAAQTLANAKASPGALSSAGESNEKFFSFEQVKNMSPAEVKKNYDAIMKSKQKWSG